jgi:uncharacterized protein YbjQ (UPF0145 family)
MSMIEHSPDDLRQRVLDGNHAVRHPDPHQSGSAVVSGLTTDELLLLHSIDWEPVELVSGACTVGFRIGTWSPFAAGNTSHPSGSLTEALARSVQRLERACLDVGAFGVVAVTTDLDIQERYASVQLTGTAVRPQRPGRRPEAAFSTNLSTKEFVVLQRGGWAPRSVAFGACFVRIRRRSFGDALSQMVRNVELANFTQALAAARADTMNKVRERGQGIGGGVVQVSISDGRLPFARHVVSFVACGTIIQPSPRELLQFNARMAVDLRDREPSFQATSLRGPRAHEPTKRSGISGSGSTWGMSIRTRLRSAMRPTNYEE